MGERGPDPKVSDDQILLEILLSPDPAVFVTEISDGLPLTPQRLTQRLEDLETADPPMVHTKMVSNRHLYWLTTHGRRHIVSVARDQLDCQP